MSELMKRRKKITEPEVRFYITQLTGALSYLHENNIIHRDLKLGNIFLDGNMRVKVGDFGLAARLTHSGERRMTLCGTPNYIAPEILQRKQGHSFEVDIWSTGIIIYTLLCGRPPYESKDVDSTYKRILHNQYSFPDHTEVSSEAKDLIQSILQLKPERRLNIKEIEAHPFFTRRDAYTPTALTSTAMREVPPSCLPGSKAKASGDMLLPVSSDENDPGMLNRLPQHHRDGAAQRDRSPPRKMAHVLPQSNRPSQQLSISDERKAKQRATSAVRQSSSSTTTDEQHSSRSRSGRDRSSSSANINKVELPPPPALGLHNGQSAASCFSERTSSKGYARQFEVYNDAKQQTRSVPVAALAAADSHCVRSHHTNVERQDGAGAYKLESVETYGGGEMDVDDEVELLQRSLEQCGIVQVDAVQEAVDQEDNVPPPPPPAPEAWTRPSNAPADNKRETAAVLTTPSVSTGKRGGNIDTLECMYETLEQSLICTDKLDFADEGNGAQKLQQGRLEHAVAPKVWVVKHVDYTSKYGLGFLMNTGSAGVYFNDSTKIVLSANGSAFQYIERRRRSSGAVEHMCQAHTLENYPAELNKKVTLLKHFKNYLVDQQSQQGGTRSQDDGRNGPSDKALQLMHDMDDGMEGEGGTDLPYVKKWVRTRHAILFRLSNKTVQVVFFDQSEILLASEARIVCFVNKEGQRSEYTLDDVFRNGRSDIAKRLKYTKDIMSRLINLQQPRER